MAEVIDLLSTDDEVIDLVENDSNCVIDLVQDNAIPDTATPTTVADANDDTSSCSEYIVQDYDILLQRVIASIGNDSDSDFIAVTVGGSDTVSPVCTLPSNDNRDCVSDVIVSESKSEMDVVVSESECVEPKKVHWLDEEWSKRPISKRRKFPRVFGIKQN